MRLIDADVVYKSLESCEIKKDTYGSLLNDWDHGYNCGIERAESEIECAPTVEAEPIRHGKWIQLEFKSIWNNKLIACSECGELFLVQHVESEHYCRNCGAKMDAQEKDDDRKTD